MNTNGSHDLVSLVETLRGLRCWYVSCGGAVGSSFQLALGEKIPRSFPLRNLAHSEEYRRFEGEASLLVWCSWRLDGLDRPLTSSDDSAENLVRELSALQGAQIESVAVLAPAWDLTVRFSQDRVLRVFCDHVPGDPSFDGNWDLRLRDVAVSVGPGARYVVESRKDTAAAGSTPARSA